MGSDLESLFNPSTSLGRSAGGGRHSNSHHGGDGELHHLHVVRFLEGGQSTSLDQELINTDQTTEVTGGNIFNSLDTTSHHQDGPLDRLLVEVILLAGNIVGSHDPALLPGGDLASEHTTEGVEPSLVRGG